MNPILLRYAGFALIATIFGAGGGYLAVNKTISPPAITRSGATPATPAQPFPGQGIPAIPAIPAIPPLAKSTATCPRVSEFSIFGLLDKSWSMKNPWPVLRDSSSGGLYISSHQVRAMLRSKSGVLFAGGLTVYGTAVAPPVLYKSLDNGANWTPIELPLLSPEYINWSMVYAMAEDSNGIIYAGGKGGLWKSSDGGDTWNVQTLPYPDNYWGGYLPITSLLITKDNSLVAVFGIGETYGSYYYPSKVFKSVDGGKTWNEIFSHNYYITSIVEANDGALVFRDSVYGNTGSVYRYSGGIRTETFTDGPASMEITAGLLKTNEGALYLISTDLETFYKPVDYTQPGNAYLSAYKSTDNGVTWTKLGSLPNSWSIQSPMVEATDGTLYAASFSVCTGNDVVYKSTNKGVSWSAVAKTPKLGTAKPEYSYKILSLIENTGGGVLVGGNAPVIFLAK